MEKSDIAIIISIIAIVLFAFSLYSLHSTAAQVSLLKEELAQTKVSPVPTQSVFEYEIVKETQIIKLGASGYAYAKCPAGKVVLGGGCEKGVLANINDFFIDRSAPFRNDTWLCGAMNNLRTAPEANLTAYAICGVVG